MLHELAWEVFSKELNRLYKNRFRYELHYKIGGDFSLLYLTGYVGKYLGILEFTNKLFKSTLPRRESDYMRYWKDSTKHSIVMHDHYNLMTWEKRIDICRFIVTKVCVPHQKNFEKKECKKLGMEICDRERIGEDYDSPEENRIIINCYHGIKLTINLQLIKQE